MIYRARVVVTMDGPPIENGAVAISENRIFDVGSFGKIKARRHSRKSESSFPKSIQARFGIGYF